MVFQRSRWFLFGFILCRDARLLRPFHSEGWFILACGGCTSRASLLLTVASESVISLILHEQMSRQMPEGGHDFSKT